MKGFDKTKFKKQLVSGGIYIALAAAVVTVTLNGVNNIIGGSEDYAIPENDLRIPENKTDFSGNNSVFDTNFGVGEKIISDVFPENMYGSGYDASTAGSTDTEVSDPVSGTESNVSDVVSEPWIGVENTLTDVPDSDTAIPKSYAANTTEKKNGSETELSVESTVNTVVSDVEYPTEPEPTSYGFYAKPAEGYIDKEYSDTNLLYSTTMGDYRTHNGVDITGDPGSPVRAINAGTVKDIYHDEFYGYTIKIDHGEGIDAYYMNLGESLPAGIKVGSKVKTGQTIGGIGNSALIESAEVSHLHLSVTRNGEYIDPRELLRSDY